jgi:hypothetical protein
MSEFEKTENSAGIVLDGAIATAAAEEEEKAVDVNMY